MSGKNRTKYNYNLDVFYKPSAISYYLLGAFMTDGNVRSNEKRKQVTLTSNDFDWLCLIRDLICKELPVKQLTKNAHRLYIHSTELGNWFISKGCTPAKSLTLQFPKVPKQFLPDFIRGCIDGDGSIGLYKDKRCNYYNKKCFLCGASKDFIIEFNKILNHKNLTYYHAEMWQSKPSLIRSKQVIQKHPIYRTTLTGHSAIQFISWVYYPNNPISMPRKAAIANTIVNTKW